MNFFSAVFSGDDDADENNDEQHEPTDAAAITDEEGEGEEHPSSGGWSFGGFVRTFAATAVRDLGDLGSGLRRETEAIRAAAATAARGLPSALDSGVSVAQESLESVGLAVDIVGEKVSTLISTGRGTLLAAAEDDADRDDIVPAAPVLPHNRSLQIAPRYTRHEAQLQALRSDPSTFAEPPEDLEGFQRWHEKFCIGDAEREEIETLLKENAGLHGLVDGLVPQVVDYETFWSRYFFRVDRLKQAEDVRAKLVNRAMGNVGDEEDDLTWEVDEEEADSESIKIRDQEEREKIQDDRQNSDERTVTVQMPDVEKTKVVDTTAEDENGDSNSAESGSKLGDIAGQEVNAGSSKNSEFSVVSKTAASEEEDLGWEEIENLQDQGESKPDDRHLGHSQRADEELRKRLNSSKDEDLTWEVDEHGKA